MEITVFAKKRRAADGRTFYNFLTSLPRKNGETQSMQIKFRSGAPFLKAEMCPCNIVIDKADCSIASRVFTRRDTGELGTAYTLWVSAYKMGSEFVDNSTDDYAF